MTTGTAAAANADKALLRRASVRRLAALGERGELTGVHVALVAEVRGMSTRTVERWLRQVRADADAPLAGRERFRIDDELRQRLAYYRGNAAALHRDLVQAASDGGRRRRACPRWSGQSGPT